MIGPEPNNRDRLIDSISRRGKVYSRRPGFLRASIPLAPVQLVLPHLLVERRAIDVELGGGGLAIPGVALQGPLNNALFRELQRRSQQELGR